MKGKGSTKLWAEDFQIRAMNYARLIKWQL